MELAQPDLRDIRETIQGERAFLLADLGRFAEAIPILETLEPSQHENSSLLFYLGYCYAMIGDYHRARPKLEAALKVGVPPFMLSAAHSSLGFAYYMAGEYSRAKLELEIGARTASAEYLKQGRIWQWLEATCKALGLEGEAERYAKLAGSSQVIPDGSK